MKKTFTFALTLPTFGLERIANFVPGRAENKNALAPSPQVLGEIARAGYRAPAHLFCPFGSHNFQSYAWEAGRMLAKAGKQVNWAAPVRVVRRGTVEVDGYTVAVFAGAIIDRKPEVQP